VVFRGLIVQETTSFQVACEALFGLLVDKAEISPGQDILDIGSGCGDSTHLLSELKPKSLSGVTSDHVQAQISKRRFPSLHFVEADAVKYVTSLGNDTLDYIFALDCAYHFSYRTTFLRESSRVLRASGRIAMTDLALGDHTTLQQRILLRFICYLTGSPFSNFVKEEQYRKQIVDAGFVNISVDDISRDVFSGLASFIKRQQEDLTRFGIRGNWSGYRFFAMILKWWDTGVVKFIVVSAEKKE